MGHQHNVFRGSSQGDQRSTKQLVKKLGSINTIFFALLDLSEGNSVACIVTRRAWVMVILLPLANLNSIV